MIFLGKGSTELKTLSLGQTLTYSPVKTQRCFFLLLHIPTKMLCKSKLIFVRHPPTQNYLFLFFSFPIELLPQREAGKAAPRVGKPWLGRGGFFNITQHHLNCPEMQVLSASATNI